MFIALIQVERNTHQASTSNKEDKRTQQTRQESVSRKEKRNKTQFFQLPFSPSLADIDTVSLALGLLASARVETEAPHSHPQKGLARKARKRQTSEETQ